MQTNELNALVASAINDGKPTSVSELMALLAKRTGAGERTPYDYPQRIPVITGDFIGFRAGDPYTIITVVLRKGYVTGEQQGESQGKLLLPGGIFSPGKHDIVWGIGVDELAEETGLVPDKTLLRRFLHSTRTAVDHRQWCGLQTSHCCNFVVAAPVSGELRPTDTAESGKRRWVDVRTMTPERTARGHFEYMQAWRAYLDRNGGRFGGDTASLLPILLSDQHPSFEPGHPQWS